MDDNSYGQGQASDLINSQRGNLGGVKACH